MDAITSLDEAIEEARRAIDISAGDHKQLVKHLNQLSSLLNDRYDNTGRVSDLDDSILTMRQAVDTITDDHLELVKCLNILGYRLQDRFSATGANSDLDEAIQTAQRAVDMTACNQSEQARCLNNLASSLKMRHSIAGEMTDLHESILLARRAVDITATDDPERAKWLNNLGLHLSDRHLITGSMTDLEEAIDLGRQAAANAIPDNPLQALFLNNLSARLDLKAETTGKPEDYEEAIQLAREVVSMTPENHPDLAKWSNSLARHLIEKFDRSWDLADLQDAIKAASKAADLTPDGATRALYLSTLANAFNHKYDKMEVLTDLEEAIHMATKALEMLPDHHPEQAQVIYLRKDTINDLDKAIRLSRAAVNARPDGHPSKPACLDRLAIQLNLRSSRSRSDPRLWADLEESIQLEKKAIGIAASSHPTWSFKNNLQAMLSLKYGLVKDRTILDECTRLQREALTEMLTSLGYRLRDGAKDASDLEEASTCFLLALQNKNAPTCCPDKEKAYQAAQASDKQHAAGSRAGVVCEAAAAALQAERGAFAALELLELGRGERYPGQARSFIRLRDELELSDTPSTSFVTDHRLSLQDQVSRLNRRHSLATELDELIVEMRKLPGFEDLWASLSESETRATAKCGPIVVINVSGTRCDALLIEQHQMRALALPNVYGKLYQNARNGDFASVQVLKWLWDNITNPILDALGFSRPPDNNEWPRVWWIPTALLTLFPLHAAGYHNKLSFETVIDRVISSYGSSVRAIIQGRHQSVWPSASNSAAHRALLVGMQHTPGSRSLSFANKEIDVVHGICESIGLDPIKPRRHKQDVTQYLLDCRIFHFAGHGYTDDEDPSNSHLCLEDWREDPLRVADLLKMDLRKHSPFLAYLSACGTGQMKKDNLVDESIHLISAYQLAGFRHVIGTLWEVDDRLCVDMARITYMGMKDGGMTDECVSWGLHKATRELRDLWVNTQKQIRPRNKSLRKGWSGKDSGNVERSRDVVICSEEEPEVGDQLQWAPYVHFGI
ncbi:CHAT domain-containing protein [Dactylonectria macrodidyma]|uniref:CHAT domain-containing protein n=1 Tax=Dactylonectria macrodidyma TaxID=307937 RepID=A0A9P9JFG1_9HYPO|nr:CHAT domain-containing protein [Dactylonectria macrodidyma]